VTLELEERRKGEVEVGGAGGLNLEARAWCESGCTGDAGPELLTNNGWQPELEEVEEDT
jgi:hypothetical protein